MSGGALRRAFAAAAAGLSAGLLIVLGGAGPAGAADDGYRYWSFWTWDEADGRWAYATQGPGTLRPGDGDVLGFRFAVSAESSDTQQPRGPGDFAEICGDIGNDSQRVALVIDFGTAEDAPGDETPPEPRTECATVADGATAAEALAGTAEPLRYNSGALLCAIAGYPARGCADRISDSGGGEAADGSGGDGSGSAVAVAAGVGVVAVLAVAGFVTARRRRG